MIGVGDLVVCVDVEPRLDNPAIHRALQQLRLGQTYRVCGVVFASGSPGLILRGVTAAYEHAGAGWRIDRFRKVSPKSASEHIERLKRLPVNDLEEV